MSNSNNVSRAARTQMVHTLVPHVSPDTEALVMQWLISSKPVVRRALNCVESLQTKFIPAGPLRRRDWDMDAQPNAKTLEAQGYLFLDCGGGRFDQHVLPDAVNENDTASLHLLLAELHDRVPTLNRTDRAEMEHLLTIMEGVFLVICKNDLKGTDVAPKSLDRKPQPTVKAEGDLAADMAAELNGTAVANEDANPTPHTPRHLRNMIIGWNILNKGNPERVAELAGIAFSAIEANVRALFENPADLQDFDVRKLFRLDEILICAPEGFAEEAEASLEALERHWQMAERDYWKSDGRSVMMQPQVEGKQAREIAVLAGRSESERFGAVARRGNTEQVQYKKVAGTKRKERQVTGPRPEPMLPRRPKADVIIQHYARGKFVISSVDGIRLDRVAMALREADLRKQNVEITDTVRAQLGSPGNFVYKARTGETVHAIYFTNYRGAVGNSFRANPYSPRSALDELEIRDIVVAVLSTSYEADTTDILRRYYRA